MRCPACGYISFDHLDTCKNCGYRLLTAGRNDSPFPSTYPLTSETTDSRPPSQPPPSHLFSNNNVAHHNLHAPCSHEGTPIPGDDDHGYTPPGISMPSHDSETHPACFNSLFADPAEGDFSEGSIPSDEGPGNENTDGSPGDRDLPRGGFWIRLLAFAIDIFCIGLIETVFSWSITLGTITGARLLEMNPETMLDVRQFLTNITGAVIVALYFIYFHARFGQTPGKRLLHLKVIRTDGSPLGFIKAAERFIGYIISLLPLYVGFLMIAFSREKQGLHDLIAGTFVIRIDS
ncbi:MAG: RDD family protein [bacterium]